MSSGLEIRTERLQGQRLINEIDSLARLRIQVFKDFPYLYEGSFDYEKEYLKVYQKSERCAVIAAFDGDKMVGAATALPLLDENDYVQKPFKKLNMPLEKIFYFGESILLPQYRGQGIGNKFFDGRESVARSYPDYNITCFCAVQRPADHPLRPNDFKPLDEFWLKRGYKKNTQLEAAFSWQDIDQKSETEKPMVFWLKEW